jgi:hypothetical protein
MKNVIINIMVSITDHAKGDYSSEGKRQESVDMSS